ncbi:hypothetical protein [Paracoccus sp. S3-43]|uniref:hypothetical protein n=1 Tax=Paracoccus sp. S3-43 TaxID=3030011 RepID=UPI0023B001EE|nr:hypothetical protein [Paracoccus sp. S3-43]WEF24676.1 hypothetical protein PXD02_01535 [Paracoccus sp. S3-43]
MTVLQSCAAQAPLPAGLTRHPGPLHAHWIAAAEQKGFDLLARVTDRLHLALRCRCCGGVSVTRLYVLMTSQPLCRTCLETARTARAAAAGLAYLGPDPDHPQYGLFRATCGHVLRRQFEIIDRVARGETGLRCETCFAKRERQIAARHGWTRIGPDPRGNPNYHLYHHNACGHTQRIARANLRWGQCDCAGCGESWAAKPSFLYLLGIRHDGRELLKLGYSANPLKRQRHQLGLPKTAQVTLLRRVAMPTGHAACAVEKRLHARLRRQHPEAVVPPGDYRGILNVVSEIYRPWLRAELERRLDRIEKAAAGGGMAPGAGAATRSGRPEVDGNESPGARAGNDNGDDSGSQDGGGDDRAAC